jgi:hypothetical protein
LTPEQTAEARRRAFLLLGDLFVNGVTSANRGHVAVLPGLSWTVDAKPDDLAVEHQRVFAFEQSPLLRAVVGDIALHRPDHVGELFAMQAIEELLAWCPPMLVAIKSRLYSPAASFAAELLATEAAEPAALDFQPSALPQDLRDLARHLTDPWKCGMYLTQSRLDALAIAADVPTGFGPRFKKLEGILHAAAEHQRLPDLLNAAQLERSSSIAALKRLGWPTGPWQRLLSGW